jgi:hypothetical protein
MHLSFPKKVLFILALFVAVVFISIYLEINNFSRICEDRSLFSELEYQHFIFNKPSITVFTDTTPRLEYVGGLSDCGISEGTYAYQYWFDSPYNQDGFRVVWVQSDSNGQQRICDCLENTMGNRLY